MRSPDGESPSWTLLGLVAACVLSCGCGGEVGGARESPEGAGGRASTGEKAAPAHRGAASTQTVREHGPLTILHDERAKLTLSYQTAHWRRLSPSGREDPSEVVGLVLTNEAPVHKLCQPRCAARFAISVFPAPPSSKVDRRPMDNAPARRAAARLGLKRPPQEWSSEWDRIDVLGPSGQAISQLEVASRKAIGVAPDGSESPVVALLGYLEVGDRLMIIDGVAWARTELHLLMLQKAIEDLLRFWLHVGP